MERQLVDSVTRGQSGYRSVGVQIKDDKGPELKVRLLFDGTNGVPINERIRVRDHDRTPAAPDIKRIIREIDRQQARPFGLKTDVKDAHRLIPIAPSDWHLLGCRSVEGGSVYINKTGTFGVASAAYWWGWLAGAMVRAAHYLAGTELPMWLPLVADDLLAPSGSAQIRSSLMLVIAWFVVPGLPLSWSKIGGGERVEWVGYELLLREAQLGITEKRAGWLLAWYCRLLEDGVVQVGRFQEGLGRAAFVCGALEYDRPFLASLYTFAALYDPVSTQPIPLYVTTTLCFLRRQLQTRRHYTCALTAASWSEGWRVDAKAEGEELGIGGWWPTADSAGVVSKARSPWFSVELTPQSAPWAFRRDGESFRLVATLEALRLLLALMVFGPSLEGDTRHQVIQLTTFTDNKGNGYAINKLMTTKFPLCAIVMELSAQMEAIGARVEVHWTPRERNEEADALSNEILRVSTWGSW